MAGGWGCLVKGVCLKGFGWFFGGSKHNKGPFCVLGSFRVQGCIVQMFRVKGVCSHGLQNLRARCFPLNPVLLCRSAPTNSDPNVRNQG